MLYFKKILLLISICIFVIPIIASAEAKWTMPDPKIKIPGIENFKNLQPTCDKTGTDGKEICTMPWLNIYIASIYKYAIGIVAIIATIVMMIGGVIWITAAGDSGRIGEAKQWMTGAVTGMILVFSSYTILYFVNPDLVKLKPIKVERIVKMEPAIPTNISTNAFISNACKNAGNNNIIYYDNLSEKASIPNTCNKYSSEFSKYAVDKKILASIAAQESGCNPSLTSPAGACGIMQLMPSTAKIYNKNADCEWLKQHPEESIKIASDYIIANTNLNTKKSDIFAGYNSGYGTGVVNGKVGGLAPSSDCKGVHAYECCINPRGLAETQDYVINTLKYYNGQ